MPSDLSDHSGICGRLRGVSYAAYETPYDRRLAVRRAMAHGRSRGIALPGISAVQHEAETAQRPTLRACGAMEIGTSPFLGAPGQYFDEGYFPSIASPLLSSARKSSPRGRSGGQRPPHPFQRTRKGGRQEDGGLTPAYRYSIRTSGPTTHLQVVAIEAPVRAQYASWD
jgi:hypothetical protein